MVRPPFVSGLLVLIGVASLSPARVLTASSDPVLTPGRSVGGDPVAPRPDFPSGSILYDQTDNDAGAGVVSQDFESVFSGYDSEGADDFVVPAHTTWAVESVSVTGTYFKGSGPAAKVNLNIFNDDAGLPGTPACSYPLQTPADTSGSFVFTLAPACILGPGTYWLDVQARMDFAAGGEWAWETRSVQSHTPALWRNPGDLLHTGCTSFAPMAVCNGLTSPDFLFSLSGEVLLFTPVALAIDPPPAVDSPAANGNGVLEIGETVAVVPSWKNDTPGDLLLLGLVSDFSGPAGPSYVVADGSADYGTLPGGATVNCAAATGDCLAIHIDGTRPAQHFDATLTEQPSAGVPSAPTNGSTAKKWTLHVGGSFGDVPSDNQFYSYIETIYHNKITRGCAEGTRYCPGDPVTRAQMAVFLLKSKNGSAYRPPPCTGTVFGDVPCTGGTFDPWIEALANQGITSGCGNGNYCPGDPVTRAQMAMLLLKTKNGSGYTPPACSGTVFTDVPCKGGKFDPWIEDIASRGITSGCGDGTKYCPGDPNTRGQMAAFLTRTFHLLLYGP